MQATSARHLCCNELYNFVATSLVVLILLLANLSLHHYCIHNSDSVFMVSELRLTCVN